MDSEKHAKKEQAPKRDKAAERIRRVVMVIGREPLPRKEIIADLGLRQASRRNFHDNYLTPAITEGYVRMLFPNVPNMPEQAYRLTAKGLDLLAELTSENNLDN
jgi:hypothetical protein